MKTTISFITFILIAFTTMAQQIDKNSQSSKVSVSHERTAMEMFFLLPDDAFQGSLPLKERKAIILDESENEFYFFSEIKDNHVYLSNEDLRIYNVYYWQLPDGRELITTDYSNGYNVNELMAYIYKDGKLVKDKNFYSFVVSTKYSLDDFLDLKNTSLVMDKKILNFFADKKWTDYIYYENISYSDDGVISLNAYFYDPEFENSEDFTDFTENRNNYYIQNYTYKNKIWERTKINEPKIKL